MKKNAYLSVDIEADGPSPYKNSMLSFGATLLTKDKKILSKWEWNLRPLEGHEADPKTMKEFWQKNAENKQAYKYCTTNPLDPIKVFQKFACILEEWQKEYKIVTVMWPSAYDWQWLNYYFAAAGTDNPLGFSAFCISTFIKSINPSKSIEWDEKFDASFNDPNYPHTHMPLDDALEQGMKFLNALHLHEKQKDEKK